MPKLVPSSSSPLKAIVMILICAAIGAGVVYKFSDQIRGLTRGARPGDLLRIPARVAAGRDSGKADKADADSTDDAPDVAKFLNRDKDSDKGSGADKGSAADGQAAAAERKKRVALERDMKRLRDRLDAMERENAEMKIQLKLLQEGSRSK